MIISIIIIQTFNFVTLACGCLQNAPSLQVWPSGMRSFISSHHWNKPAGRLHLYLLVSDQVKVFKPVWVIISLFPPPTLSPANSLFVLFSAFSFPCCCWCGDSLFRQISQGTQRAQLLLQSCNPQPDVCRRHQQQQQSAQFKNNFFN